jgi:hypothetical protein
MREVVYAMRFVGRAEPIGEAGHVLRATARAPSGMVTSIVDAAGVVGTLTPVPGDEAAFTSQVTFTGETSFLETGAIGFGPGAALRFATVGHGYLNGSADPRRRQGSVMWRVEAGEGRFAGATGLITSNFFVDAELGVVDHQFGVLLLPDAG